MKAMTLRDAEAFVKYFHGKRIAIELEDCGDFDAFAKVGENRITIDTAFWHRYRYYPGVLRVLLAHEVGHFHTDHRTSQYRRELDTHLWAIRRAREKGTDDLGILLKAEFVNWKRYTDRCYKRYKDARRFFVEKGMRY